MVNDVVVKEPMIPMHLSDEMRLVIGDGKKGYLSPKKEKRHEIEWDWIGRQPTYVVRFISPRAFGSLPGEQLGTALEVVKLLFGGPIDVIQDRVLNTLVDQIATPATRRKVETKERSK